MAAAAATTPSFAEICLLTPAAWPKVPDAELIALAKTITLPDDFPAKAFVEHIQGSLEQIKPEDFWPLTKVDGTYCYSRAKAVLYMHIWDTLYKTVSTSASEPFWEHAEMQVDSMADAVECGFFSLDDLERKELRDIFELATDENDNPSLFDAIIKRQQREAPDRRLAAACAAYANDCMGIGGARRSGWYAWHSSPSGTISYTEVDSDRLKTLLVEFDRLKKENAELKQQQRAAKRGREESKEEEPAAQRPAAPAAAAEDDASS